MPHIHHWPIIVALSACAPMMSAPPSVPMAPMTTRETGHGLNAAAMLDGEHSPMYIGGYQFWLRKPTGNQSQHEHGILVQAGWPNAISAGVYKRKALTRSDIHYLGFQGALGLLWAGAALPAALKVSDTVWITTQPSYSHGGIRLFQFPLGLSYEMGGNARLDAEVGLNIWNKKQSPDPPDIATSFKELKNLGPYVGISYSKPIGQAKSSDGSPVSQ